MAKQVDVPAFQIVEETGEHQPLGRDVEQAVFAVVQSAQARAGFFRGERRIEECGGDAAGLQSVDLVFHQRDQRRDDDGEAGADERGQLEAERFAAAGGQHGEDVFAGEGVADDFLLQRAKRGEAEIFFQRFAKLQRFGHGESFGEMKGEFKSVGRARLVAVVIGRTSPSPLPSPLGRGGNCVTRSEDRLFRHSIQRWKFRAWLAGTFGPPACGCSGAVVTTWWRTE